MNTKKVISHFMMDIMDEAVKARMKIVQGTKDGIFDMAAEELEVIEVCLKNIEYYARIILEGDGAE